MIKIQEKNNLILMTRGDTLIVDVDIYDAGGNKYIPDPNDQLRFALKEHYDDEYPLITKTIPVDTC